jgi:drug/metabolite transporter, DME family
MIPVSRAHRAPLGAGALVLASLAWGTTGTAASFLPADVSPLAIGASTMAIGGALLFLVSARSAVAVIRDSRSRRWVFLGAIGVFVYPLAFYSSMNLAGVAIGNVVALGSGPVFAALLEWGIQRRQLSRRWLISTFIAVVGVTVLAMGGRTDVATGDRLAPGVALGLLAGFAYALYTYCSSRALDRVAEHTEHGGRAVVGAMFGVGAIALAPVLAVTGSPLLQSTSTVSIALYLAVVPMFVAYLLFGFGLTYVRSSAATTITLLEPFVATLLAVLVVGERLAVLGWFGLALILVGVAVLVTARQPHGTRTGS